jgi:hypothetical protein
MTEPLLSFTPKGFQFAWDATSISAFEKCPRYYQLRHLEGWQPQNKSEHLIFGGVYASALEHFAKKLAAGMDREQATREVVHEAMIATWTHERETLEDGTTVPVPGTGTPWESFNSAKTRETLIRSIVWYLAHFENDPAETLILSDGTPAAELSFSLPFGDQYLYCGHMDKIVTYAGNIYVQDQKTSGNAITGHFFDNFTPDVQMSGYAWAGNIMFALPISGVMIDAAQIAVGFTRFARGFVSRPPALLDEWYENTMWTIEQAKVAHETGIYRMNRQSCGNYGGCDFRRVCSRHPEHRNAVLNTDFTRAPRWDPLQRR